MLQIGRILTFLSATLLPVPALAEDDASSRPVIVELFSSQNCAACPKANKNLIELSDELNIVPLTYSVDYWDYLGWADTFAKPEFAERQKTYVERFSLRGPYTPQTVYDGRKQCSALKKDDMRELIADSRSTLKLQADVTITKNSEGAIQATIEKHPDLEDVDVWLVNFFSEEMDVIPTTGDNAGKTMIHRNVVNGITPLDWHGSATPMNIFCDPACAVLVQEPGGGPIVGAGVYGAS